MCTRQHFHGGRHWPLTAGFGKARKAARRAGLWLLVDGQGDRGSWTWYDRTSGKKLWIWWPRSGRWVAGDASGRAVRWPESFEAARQQMTRVSASPGKVQVRKNDGGGRFDTGTAGK
jgi:hypothetical protein